MSKGFFRHTSKRTVYTVLGILIILIAARIALPYVVLKYVNKTLSELDGYDGHVNDIDISLYRGAYKIEGIEVVQLSDGKAIPFFKSPLIDLSVEWTQIWNGNLVAEIVVMDPELNFIASMQSGEGVDWREPIKDLVPININRLEVLNGTVFYKDYNTQPNINLYASALNGSAENLTNSEDVSETLVADINARAQAMGQAPMTLGMSLDPFDEKGTFDLKFEMKELNVTEMNDFLEAYIKVDAKEGTFSLYSEFNAEQGKFSGYVKPLVHDLEVFDLDQDKDKPLKMIWEAAVAGVTEVFENHRHDQLGTVMQFEGDLNNPDLNILKMIGEILKNAFIKVLPEGLQGKDNNMSGVKQSESGEDEDKGGIKGKWKSLKEKL